MFAIGPSLREARSRRGLSSADVQKAIRIRERYLTAIEEERWELLPGDAYTKGFLRTYAEFLGLDGTLYVDEFNSRFAHHDEEPLVPAALARSRVTRVGLVRPIVVIGALVAVVAAVAAWQLHGSGSASPAAAPPATTHEKTKPATTHTLPRATKTVPAVPAAATHAVLSATRGRVWLLVRVGGATGKVLFEGVLDQGETLPVSLADPVWLRVGAPWNLDVKLAGKVVPGLPAKVGDVVLTPQGLTPTA